MLILRQELEGEITILKDSINEIQNKISSCSV
jgi:hypothetical protein